MKFRNLLLFTITLLLVLVSANEITPELITAFKVDR